MILIAEVKTQSPFGFKSDKEWVDLFEIALDKGDWISIHIEKEWGGSLDDLSHARRMTDRPILAKGFHRTIRDIENSFNAGATYVLAVGYVPSLSHEYWNRIIVEPLTVAQLKTVDPRMLALWNARDLKTGERKRETFQQARAAWSGWLCQASMIESHSDIEPTANAILVGQHLEKISL